MSGNENSKSDFRKAIELFVVPTLTALIVVISQAYLSPYIANKTNIQKEHWTEKRMAYQKSIRLIDRHFSGSQWMGPDIPEGYTPTSEPVKQSEINTVYMELLFLSETSDIPQMFSEFFGGENAPSPTDRGEFVLMLRNELFESEVDEIGIDPAKIPYFLEGKIEKID